MPRYTLCPFFKYERKARIGCEDIYRDFPSNAKKWAWMDAHCDSDWKSCPYAIEINAAYDRAEKGDKKAVEKHNINALKRELRSVETKLGRAQKRAEELDKQKYAMYCKWKVVSKQLDDYERNIDDQIKKITQVYEQRICYLIETFAPNKSFYEDSAEAWAGDKKFALIIDQDVLEEDKRIMWKVVYGKDEPGEDLQEHEQENEVRQ